MEIEDIGLAAQRRVLTVKEQEIRAHRRALEAHQRAAKLHDSLGQAREAAQERRFVAQVQQRLQAAIAERDAMQASTASLHYTAPRAGRC